MEFLIIKDGENKPITTPCLARFNPFLKEDLFTRNGYYLILDTENSKLKWIRRVELDFTPNGIVQREASLHSDDHIETNYNMVVSANVVSGVHYLSIFGDCFKGVSVTNEKEYKTLLDITNRLPSSILEECIRLVTTASYPEWHSISNEQDVWNLFYPTLNLNGYSFMDMNIAEDYVKFILKSPNNCDSVEMIFESVDEVSKAFTKAPLAKWKSFRFLFENDLIYFLNNQEIDDVAGIKSTTKFIRARHVKYKLM